MIYSMTIYLISCENKITLSKIFFFFLKLLLLILSTKCISYITVSNLFFIIVNSFCAIIKMRYFYWKLCKTFHHINLYDELIYDKLIYETLISSYNSRLLCSKILINYADKNYYETDTRK